MSEFNKRRTLVVSADVGAEHVALFSVEGHQYTIDKIEECLKGELTFEFSFGGEIHAIKSEALTLMSCMTAVMPKSRRVARAPKEKLEPLPDYGDHMTLADFRMALRTASFIPDDGHGVYATATEMSDVQVPMDADAEPLDPRWTHVVWFNK